MKLKMENFRNFGNADAEFGKINIIGGKSGAGKSTIKAALAYAYTGVNILGTDNIIKDGAGLTHVALQDGFLAIDRKSKPGANEVRLNGSKITNKAMEEELVSKLGVNYQNLVMMFDSSKFLSLSENEQKDYLYQICGMQITADTLKNYCSTQLPKRAEDLLLEQFGTSIIEPAHLDAAYKAFFISRTAIRKELAEVDSKIKGFGGKSAPVNADEIKAKIAGIDKKVAKLDAEKATLMVELGATNERAKQINDLDQLILNLHTEIKALERQIDPNLDVGEAEIEVFEHVQKIFKFEEEYKVTAAKLNTLKGEVKANTEIIAKLGTHGCPLTDKLVCTADKGLLKKSLEEAVAQKTLEVNDLQRELDKTELNLNIEKKAKERLDEQMSLDHKKTEATKKKTEAEIALSKIPPVNQTIAQQVSEKDAEIVELKKERQNFNIAAENVVILAELVKKKEKLDLEVEALDILVKELSPKGVKQAILQKVLDKVETFGNQAVKVMIPNNEIKFSFDNGFTIKLIDTKMNTNRSSNDLSSGEKLRLSIVFQYIFSNITGAKIIFVDDLNLVDPTTRSSIFKLLKDISVNFNQMIVSITEDDMNNLLSYQSEMDADKLFFVYDGDIIEQ